MIARDGPRIITVDEIARLLGWPQHRARRWMKSTGIGFKHGSRYVTTIGRMGGWPELLELFLEEEAC